MSNELYHHGILGMHWGKKNGPPYPLDAGDHSASERKAGWRKSLDKKDAFKSSGNHDTAKKVLKAVGTAAAVAGIAYVSYKVHQNANLSDVANLIDAGKKAMNRTDLAMDTPIAKFDPPKFTPDPFKVEKFEVPKFETPKVTVKQSTIPTLTIDRSDPSGRDYTSQILSNFGKLSAATVGQSSSLTSFEDLDDITMSMLRRAGG